MATINDIVLIYFEDQPFSYARVEEISPDAKKDWYHVKLLLLQIPLETVTWILRDVYIDGLEFTMGGKRMRLEKVVAPEEPDDDDLIDEDLLKTIDPDASEKKNSIAKAKVVTLTDRKPKK